MSDGDQGYVVVRGGETMGIGALLPPGIVAVEAVDAVAPDALLAGEAAIIARAIESRQLEFARGRSCARRALAVHGIAPAPILSNDRAPIWPPGVIGSITHCRDYCCAAVASTEQYSTLGIDAEILKPMSSGVQEQIMIDAELRRLAGLDPSIPWPCVVFSAKEALYKAWYPIAKRWLEFHEVSVRLDVARGRFEADMLCDELATSWPRTVEGRFTFDRGRVLAAVVLGRASSAGESPRPSRTSRRR